MRERTAPDGDAVDAEDARDAIRERGESIRREELRRALDRLGSQGELTDEQRETVRRMADAVVDGVLVAPASALADGDADAVRTALDLFDLDR